MKQIKNTLQNKLNYLDKLKPRIEKSLSKAPSVDGSLVLSTSHGKAQYYLRDQTKKRHYLEKANMQFITTLAQKEYDFTLLKELEKQKTTIQKLLKLLPEQDIQGVYHTLPKGRKNLVNPHFLTDEQYTERWLSVKYDGKSGYDDDLKYTTNRGEKVRSKSEKIIADKLYSLGIPYRYEYPVLIQGLGTVYIDFVILDVKSRKEIYYEHFGRMDELDYCNKTLKKLQNYPKNDIVLGKNFIATFESSKHPFDISILEIMLQEILA